MTDTLPLTCQTCGNGIDAERSEGVCALCLFDEALEHKPNETFGGHELCGEIARGGMGVVYRAMQREPQREVALKTLRGAELDSPEARARFRDEARSMAELDHPGILPIHQFGQQDGVLFFTMKLAAGGSLAERTADYAGQWKKIAALIATVADAVQFAHEHGVLHRDIKPGNILFDEENHAFVSDFGLAKLAERSDGGLTVSAAMLGTPHYMAPEIAAHGLRAATTATDVWSLGVVLYELLVQARPFKSNSVPALMREIAEREPDALPQNVPADLRIITRKALAKDAARRYDSAHSLADDLRSWLEGRPITARPTSSTERLWLWTMRNPVISVLSALLVVALLTGGGLLFRAYRVSNEALRTSLITQARFIRTSGQMGQRHDALAALQRAAAIRMDTDIVSECAAALARVDLLTPKTWWLEFIDRYQLPEFSPDVTQCAVPEKSGGFILRAADDGRELHRFPAAKPAITFAFSPDGRSIAAKLSDDVLQIWPVDASTPVAVMPCSQAYGMRAGIPASFSSPLGAWAVVARDGAIMKVLPTGETSVWVPATGRIAGSLRFDSQGGRLAIAYRDGLDLWQMSGEARLLWSINQPATLAPLAWHASGDYLATTVEGDIREVFILRAASGEISARLRGPVQTLPRLAFHPSRFLLAGLANDCTLHLWDCHDGRELLVAQTTDRSLAWSPDGRRLGCGFDYDRLGVFELSADTVLREFGGNFAIHQGNTGALTETPRQRWLLGSYQSHLSFWDTATRQFAGEMVDPQLASSFAMVTPDEKWCVYTTSGTTAFVNRRPLHISPEGMVTLGKKETMPGTDNVAFGAVSADGAWIVYRNDLRQYESWPDGDASRAAVLLHLAHEDAAFSPDRRWAVHRRPNDTAVHIVDCADPKWHKDIPLAGASYTRWSPDGRWVFARGNGENLLLEAGTWRERARWPTGGARYGTTCAEFSADSQRLALSVGNESIQVLSVPDLRLIVSLTPPQALDFRHLVFCQDGSKLWAMGVAGRVFEWNLDGLHDELKKLGMEWRR